MEKRALPVGSANWDKISGRQFDNMYQKLKNSSYLLTGNSISKNWDTTQESKNKELVKYIMAQA